MAAHHPQATSLQLTTKVFSPVSHPTTILQSHGPNIKAIIGNGEGATTTSRVRHVGATGGEEGAHSEAEVVTTEAVHHKGSIVEEGAKGAEEGPLGDHANLSHSSSMEITTLTLTMQSLIKKR